MSLLIIRYSPPTPESNRPAKSSPNVTHYETPDETPDAELSHEPSIRFHCPSSRDSSVSKSDFSVAGSVAEDDLNEDVDDDDLEALRQVAEGSPSPTHLRLRAPTESIKEKKSTEQAIHSNMGRNEQNTSLFVGENEAGDSEHNPIQLDNDTRVQDVVVDESDEEGPEVVSTTKMCDGIGPKHQTVPLPYGYMLETAAVHGQPNGSPAGNAEVSDEFEVADTSDEDDFEYDNQGPTDQTIQNHGKESKVYQSTYIEVDEEDDDPSSSVAGTEEDDLMNPRQPALPEGSNEDIEEGSDIHPDILQSKFYPDALVDHTQRQIQGVPEAGTSPILNGSYGHLPLHDRVIPGHSKVSDRAPSPSDAAMAKASSVTDPQLGRGLCEGHNYGQNAPRAVQNIQHDRTVTGTEDFLPTFTRSSPLINHDISSEYGTSWPAFDRVRTPYSDGPFRNNANRVPALYGETGDAANLLVQDTASNSRHPGCEGTHLFHDYRAARTFGRSFNEETSNQPGQGVVPVDPYYQRSSNKLGSAMLFAAPTSISEPQDQSSPLPTTARANTRLSIGDIVETESASAQSLVPILGTKRKADEISTDEHESIPSPCLSQSSAAVSNPDNISIPDAQPSGVGEFATQSNSTQSTETSLGPSRASASTPTRDNRPKKRVKTVAKWIGTTILLGVGAVVTIAATAPQSVWDEIDREMGLV